MFNHARTLLLNTHGGGKSPGPDFLGEELIPEEFYPLRLPTYLNQIRQFLFGAAADRAMLNYRAKQFMSVIHATELEEFVLELDSRITYDTADENTLYLPSTFQPNVNRYSGADPDTLTLLGRPDAPDAHGRIRFDYDVDVLTPTTIEVKRQTPVTFSDIQTLTITNGLSNQLDLVGTGYKFFVNTDSPGAAWTVSGYHRPQWSIGEIVALLERLSEPVSLSLFGLTRDEPWETFRNLWFEHPETPYRLGGFLMAVIYRTEEVRLG